MYQISSLMAAAEGPVAEFSSFVNFKEKIRKSNKSLFRSCRQIFDIFGFTLLRFAKRELET